MVWFSAGLGTLCLNLNQHLWVRSSLLPNLNPEVRLRCGCKPSAPEVQGLNWAKYGKRSQKKFPAKSLNSWFRCRFGQNSHLLHLEPEPWVWFGFAPGSAGSWTGPQTVYQLLKPFQLPVLFQICFAQGHCQHHVHTDDIHHSNPSHNLSTFPLQPLVFASLSSHTSEHNNLNTSLHTLRSRWNGISSYVCFFSAFIYTCTTSHHNGSVTGTWKNITPESHSLDHLTQSHKSKKCCMLKRKDYFHLTFADCSYAHLSPQPLSLSNNTQHNMIIGVNGWTLGVGWQRT